MKNYQVNSAQTNAQGIACANCWGHQEYNGQAFNKSETEKGKMHAFILKFVRRYF
jgi:hypothetical protein